METGSDPSALSLPSPRDIDQSILDLARPQYGLVAANQISDIRVGSLRARRDNLRLLTLGQGVFALGRPIRGRRAGYMAAILAGGTESVLADKTAADLWGIREYRGPIEIVRRESRSPRRFFLEPPGVESRLFVRVRRTRVLPPEDVTTRYGIPILTAARTLLNLAAVLDADELADAFGEADRLGHLREEDLLRCASRGFGWRGIGTFRRLVERRHPKAEQTRSLLEIKFLELCAKHAIEEPDINIPVGRYYPDFRWPDLKLIVEVDGFDGHSGRIAFLNDAHRENELRADGNQVIRFTWEEVTQQEEWVAGLVKAERERCALLVRHQTAV